jgi:hypothetical protein
VVLFIVKSCLSQKWCVIGGVVHFWVDGCEILLGDEHTDVALERFPFVSEMVLSILLFYLALYCGRAMIVSEMFCFSTSSDDLVLRGGTIKVNLISFLQSFVLNFCAGLVKVMSVHSLVPLRVTLRIIRKPLASLQTLGKIDASQVLSGSCISVPSSAVICSLGLARASVIVLALRPCPASNGVQFIAELKTVLCANTMAGR